MKICSIVILLLCVVSYLVAQNRFTITTVDSATHVIPDVSKAPWFGESSLGATVVDTLRVVMVLGQVRTKAATLDEGTLIWKKGYFVNSRNLYLDINKKPISNSFRVFSTFPWW